MPYPNGGGAVINIPGEGGSSGLANAFSTIRVGGQDYAANGESVLEFSVSGGSVAAATISGGVRVTVTPAASGETASATYTNVKDFGAIGNGIADDTAAIQSAINSLTTGQGITSGTASGGTVLLPAGTYKLTGELVLYGNITLKGAGCNASMLDYAPSSGAAIRLTPRSGQNEIHNVRICEMGIRAYNGTAGALGAVGGSRYAILNMIVRDVLLYQVRGVGINLAAPTYPQRCRFEDITAYSCGGQIIRIDGNHNTIRNVGAEGGWLSGFTGAIDGLIEVRGAGNVVEDCVIEPICNGQTTSQIGVLPTAWLAYNGDLGTTTSATIRNCWNEMHDNGSGYYIRVVGPVQRVSIDGGAPTPFGLTSGGNGIRIESATCVDIGYLQLQIGVSAADVISTSGTCRAVIGELEYRTTPGTIPAGVFVASGYDLATNARSLGLPSASAGLTAGPAMLYLLNSDGHVYGWTGSINRRLSN